MKHTCFDAKTTPFGAALLTLLLSSFWMGEVRGQQPTLHCGSIVAPPPNGSNPDSLILDRFGNMYDLEDLLIPQSSSPSTFDCPSGFFNLTFDADFPMNMRPTVCQVFEDLSALIVPHSNTLTCGDVLSSGSVDIDVVWDPTLPPNVLGTGTPFYSGPTGGEGFCIEMILDRPFIKINGGIISPLLDIFDGRLAINASPANPWHIDWNTPVGGNEVDLYSVALHEALHILGFASRVGLNDAFTLWDRILHVGNFAPNGGSSGLIPILTNSAENLPCTTSSINCWFFKG